MPELPEVETVARELRRLVLNKRIKKVEVLWPKTFIRSGDLDITGQVIVSVGRKGKYLLLKLSRDVLIVHLRMTGQLLFVGNGASNEADNHLRTVIHFADGSRLLFRDVRKFGRIWLTDNPAQVLKNVGPDALDEQMDFSRFFGLLRKRKTSIKAFLLSQRFISGLGNIYTDESLFRAGVHPASAAAAIDRETAQSLFIHIRQVLQEALDNMGSTISDYRDAEGSKGSFQNYFAVYSRAGLPCKKCARPIVKEKLAGRGTHFCPQCQKIYK